MAKETTRKRQNQFRDSVECPVRVACDGTALVAEGRRKAGMCCACEDAQKRRNKPAPALRGTGYRGP
jgi:hypothetical protein